MARTTAILRALGTAFRRDWKSFGSVGVNNFFPVTVLLLGRAGGFIYLLAGLVMLFPMSTDPLRKIPASRLALWPLEPRERILLRLASPWLNPITWILAILAVWALRGRITLGLWALAAGLVAAGFLFSEVPAAGKPLLWRRIPAFPGTLEQLIRKNVREIFSTLDFYIALLLSATGLVYRLARLGLPHEAFADLGLLALLALSSYPQCLFGLDGEGGLSRYRLLPLRGWRLLAAKDLAYLAVVLLLMLPLDPVSGIGGAMVCLALGHAPSVQEPREQVRWRFSTGVSLVYSFVQVAGMAAAWGAIAFTSTLFLIPCAAAWLVSTAWYGRQLERRDGREYQY
jgi:hypothetical protein